MAKRQGAFGAYMDRRSTGHFKIQITSMVDMFVILLVFLLKTYSTSPVNITPKQGMTLPGSSSLTEPIDVVKLIVSEDGVFVEDKKVMDLEKGRMPASFVDSNDPEFMRPLYEALDAHAKHAKEISKVNDSFEFDGKVLMQADRGLNYEILQKVMYTSMMAGYADVKLAVIAK
jgi:biopolymer transport protein ExbD